jgi:hypothetical protein
MEECKVPPIQENPDLDVIRINLKKSEESLKGRDKRVAIEYYNKAKELFERNKFKNPDIIKIFYDLSVKIDGFS